MNYLRDFSISEVESEREEWKEVFTDILLERGLQTLCAFLNGVGGRIIFGVTFEGKPVRLSCNLDEAQRKVFDKTRVHLEPPATSFFSVNPYEGRLYIFVKPDPSHIYQYSGVIYKRTGSSTHALTYEEAKALENQRAKGAREVAPGVFSRVLQGEVLRCINPNCGYSEVSGLSSIISVGGPPPERKCPRCDSILSSNLS